MWGRLIWKTEEGSEEEGEWDWNGGRDRLLREQWDDFARVELGPDTSRCGEDSDNNDYKDDNVKLLFQFTNYFPIHTFT
jgi:hypothetical protein